MKKFITIIMLSLVSTAGALAQTSAGTMSLSGTGYYKEDRSKYINNTDTYKYRYNNIRRDLLLNSTIGYFIADDFELGIWGTAYQNRHTDKSKSVNMDDRFNDSHGLSRYNYFSYSAGTFLRKYFFLNERFAITATTNIGFSFYSNRSSSEGVDWSGEEYERSSEGPKSNALTASLSAGVMYFVTDKFGINAGLGGMYYSRCSTKEERTTNEGISYLRKVKGNSGGLSFSPEFVNLGLSYYFGGN